MQKENSIGCFLINSKAGREYLLNQRCEDIQKNLKIMKRDQSLYDSSFIVSTTSIYDGNRGDQSILRFIPADPICIDLKAPRLWTFAQYIAALEYAIIHSTTIGSVQGVKEYETTRYGDLQLLEKIIECDNSGIVRGANSYKNLQTDLLLLFKENHEKWSPDKFSANNLTAHPSGFTILKEALEKRSTGGIDKIEEKGRTEVWSCRVIEEN